MGANRHIYQLTSPQARDSAKAMIGLVPDGFVCEIKESTRTTEQNSLLWPLLTEVSRQVDWYGKKLTPDEWKSVFSASLKQQKVVPGLDGGFVVCAQSTSRMGKREFSDLIELIFAFGAEKGVRFPDVHHMDMAAA